MIRDYWISWYQPTSDYRPINFPPNPRIKGYWCTGQRCSDEAFTVVAQVTADSFDDAKFVIMQDWPEAIEWRFCEETTPSPPSSSRFPLADWMRFDVTA